MTPFAYDFALRISALSPASPSASSFLLHITSSTLTGSLLLPIKCQRE